jgi:hypothetical protein
MTTSSETQPQQQEGAELKPCPFDGRTPALKKVPTRSLNPADDYWIIACEVYLNGGEPLISDGCGIYQQGRTREEVIQRWNTRADLPRATAEAEDDLVDEVQRRMDQVVEAAVEWHQSGREGDNSWFDKSEALSAAIESLLELRTAPAPASVPAEAAAQDESLKQKGGL